MICCDVVKGALGEVGERCCSAEEQGHTSLPHDQGNITTHTIR